MHRRRLAEWARARNPLPSGTAAAGVGFVVAGITIYGFLAISARVLGPERYAPLSVLWAMVFLAAPGFYYPLEQEVGRALSDRRARRVGGRPVVARAAAMGLGFAALLVAVTVVASGPLLDRLFDDQVLLLAGFALAMVAYAVEHLARGTLSGNGRFGSYGWIVGTEGVVRLLACIGLAALGVRTAGAYGLVLGVAPLVATAVGLARQEGLARPGPPAPWNELTSALGYLLLGSVLAQAMINAAPLLVRLLAEPGEEEVVGSVLIALIVARVPVFMFQAVQASLIPNLAGLAAAGRRQELHHRLLRLMGALAGSGAAFALAAGLLGPWVVRVFFGSEFELPRLDMALLAGASAAFMLALALAQALIALTGYGAAAFGWVVGMATLVGVTALPGETVLRVERGFLAGALVAAAVMAVLLAGVLRREHLEVSPAVTAAAAPAPPDAP